MKSNSFLVDKNKLFPRNVPMKIALYNVKYEEEEASKFAGSYPPLKCKRSLGQLF